MTREQKIRNILKSIEEVNYELTSYDKSIDNIPQKTFDNFISIEDNLLQNYEFRIKNKKMIIEIDNVYFNDWIEIDMRLLTYKDYLFKYGNEDYA